MTEEWRDIDGTFGNYQVSNTGYIRSKKKNGWRVLKRRENSRGYYRVLICFPSKKQVFVHREVAKAFVENPNNCPIVNHLDCDPHNCRADNLEWTTFKGNAEYARKLGRLQRTDAWAIAQTKALRERMGKAIVGTSIESGEKIYIETLNQCTSLGFQPSCVSNCCNGKRHQTGGYTWKFASEYSQEEISQLKEELGK